MIRALLRLVLVVAILVAVGSFLLGYWSINRTRETGSIGTSGSTPADVSERARERGAEIGERVGAAAGEAGVALADAALSAKIKSKMALDDAVKAIDVSVHTTNGVATLTGAVRTAAERERAVRLARETEGIHQVVDRIEVRP
jgi:hypothetical protein